MAGQHLRDSLRAHISGSETTNSVPTVVQRQLELQSLKQVKLGYVITKVTGHQLEHKRCSYSKFFLGLMTIGKRPDLSVHSAIMKHGPVQYS